MKLELPEFKRCCFCIPLRYGLLALTYIKMIFELLVGFFISIMLINYMMLFMMYGMPQLLIIIIIGFFIVVFILLDIGFSIVFLVGGHRKILRLLRLNYKYSIVFLCVTTVVLVIINILDIAVSGKRHLKNADFSEHVSFGLMTQARIIIILFNIGTDAYYVLLLRSEIRKLESNCNFRFNNIAADAACTMESGNNDNGTYTPGTNAYGSDESGTQDSGPIVTGNLMYKPMVQFNADVDHHE